MEVSSTMFIVFGAMVLPSVTASVISAFGTTSTDVSPRFVRTIDLEHSAWPNPAAIPYRVDARYSLTDQALIQAAMTQISTDTNQCIQFVPYVQPTTGIKPHLVISPSFTTSTNLIGAPIPNCFSFPAFNVKALAAPNFGAQKLGLTNGTDGCITGNNVPSKREVMKYLVNALGLRDEWRRPDRDTFLTVNQPALKPTIGGVPSAEIIRKYATTGVAPVQIPSGQVAQVDALTTFDSNSITMPVPTKYAVAGTPFYTMLPDPTTGVTPTIPTLAQLSFDDCRGLQAIYSTLSTTCSSMTCADPYNPTNPQLTTKLTPVPNPVQQSVLTAVASGGSSPTGTIIGATAAPGACVDTGSGAIEPCGASF